MALGKEVGPGPGHIVLHGNPDSSHGKRHNSPSFRPMSIVAKRSPISTTAELLFILVIATTDFLFTTKIRNIVITV